MVSKRAVMIIAAKVSSGYPKLPQITKVDFSRCACPEGVCMIDNGPGSVEDDNGDDKDATSIDSGNHLGLVAAIDKGAI